MSFKIRDININNDVVLAPMAGFSNSIFRNICLNHQAGFVVSEMVSSKGLCFNNTNTLELLTLTNEEHPIGIQLFGNDITSLVEAVKYLNEHSDCDFIDFNMGCPVPKVAGKGQSGSFLMTQPDKVRELLSAMVIGSKKPITVKIRSGWDYNHINAVEIAKICQDCGVSLVTVHARNRSQAYSGIVDLDVIRDVKNNVDIPVIGNGDVTTFESFLKMMEYTNCDGVMIGRAAIGNPWLFEEISAKSRGLEYNYPSKLEVLETLNQVINSNIISIGEHRAFIESKGYLRKYLRHLKLDSSLLKSALMCTSLSDLLHILEKIKIIINQEP